MRSRDPAERSALESAALEAGRRPFSKGLLAGKIEARKPHLRKRAKVRIEIPPGQVDGTGLDIGHSLMAEHFEVTIHETENNPPVVGLELTDIGINAYMERTVVGGCRFFVDQKDFLGGIINQRTQNPVILDRGRVDGVEHAIHAIGDSPGHAERSAAGATIEMERVCVLLVERQHPGA